MEPHPSVLKALNKEVNRSTHRKHQMGCVIVGLHGEIVSNGCAHVGERRLNETYSLHAEAHAIARGRHKSLGWSVAFIMAKARKSGNIVTGRPCLTCGIALRAAGIRQAFYSTPSGFEELDLDDDISHLKVYPTRRIY